MIPLNFILKLDNEDLLDYCIVSFSCNGDDNIDVLSIYPLDSFDVEVKAFLKNFPNGTFKTYPVLMSLSNSILLNRIFDVILGND